MKVLSNEKRYVVTGDREVTSVLTVHDDGRWELSKGTLYDVTHLPCRSGLYTTPPGQPASACTPDASAQKVFPVKPGAKMPPIGGCAVQDWAVLVRRAIHPLTSRLLCSLTTDSPPFLPCDCAVCGGRGGLKRSLCHEGQRLRRATRSEDRALAINSEFPRQSSRAFRPRRSLDAFNLTVTQRRLHATPTRRATTSR